MTARKEFAAARSEQQGEVIEFGFYGDTFSVQTPLPGIVLMDLADAASRFEGMEESPEAGAAAMSMFKSVLAECLGDKEFNRFRKVCARNRVDITEIIDVGKWIIAEGSGRPTEQQPQLQEPSSDDGPSSGEAA